MGEQITGRQVPKNKQLKAKIPLGSFKLENDIQPHPYLHVHVVRFSVTEYRMISKTTIQV